MTVSTATTAAKPDLPIIHLCWTRLHPRPAVGAGDEGPAAPCPRSSHGLSFVPAAASNDGGGIEKVDRLILIGGENQARTPLDGKQFCWALDFLPDPDDADHTKKYCRWRLIEQADGAPEPRIAHAQAVDDTTGTVYVFGGRAGISMNEQAMNDMWALDCSGPPGTERWHTVEYETIENESGFDIPEARSFHKMVCIDRQLYVFGGCGASSGRLADLHRFDLRTNTWKNLGSATQLRGRGGPNLVPLMCGLKLAVVAGFAGEETQDGQIFDVEKEEWEEDPDETLARSYKDGLRPRSVCVSAAFPSAGVAVIFGGEVDPSNRGHEGAGNFANDIVLLDARSGMVLRSVDAKSAPSPSCPSTSWPESRGWSDGASRDMYGGRGKLFIFGGLAGDDKDPLRLDDLWRLDVCDDDETCLLDMDSSQRRAT